MILDFFPRNYDLFYKTAIFINSYLKCNINKMCYVNTIVFKSLECCYEKSDFVYNCSKPEVFKLWFVNFACIGRDNYVDSWFSQIDVVLRIVC